METETEPQANETPERVYRDEDLIYAATSRCPCGAGLAYHKGIGIRGHWDCSDILTGRAIPSGQEGAKTHTDRLPFAFWSVLSEEQKERANGQTTRPAGARTLPLEVEVVLRAIHNTENGTDLRHLAHQQAKLQAFYAQVRPQGFYEQAPRERCLTWTRALIHEACEVEEALDWKPWANPRHDAGDPDNRKARLEETTDVLFFWLNLVADQGFTVEEVVDAYRAKLDINVRRQLYNPRYAPSPRQE